MYRPGFEPTITLWHPLHECQYHIIRSEAPPILSCSSREDESNAGFPVSIVLPVSFLEEISSSCLSRANGTCLVPFLEHPGIDTITFPSLACIERRRSGPNRISRLASKRNFVKSRATCHRHVPRGRKHFAIGQIALLSSVRAEQNLTGTSPFSRSSTRSKGVKIQGGTGDNAVDLAKFRSLN